MLIVKRKDILTTHFSLERRIRPCYCEFPQ